MSTATQKLGSAVQKRISPGPEDAILFVGMCLVLGMASRQLLRRTRVPYTVALVLLGIGLGALEYGTHHGLGRLGASIRVWANINPNLILFIFLPPLLFESSFAMDMHQIKAENGAEVSGVLTVMILGIVYAAARTIFESDSLQRTTQQSYFCRVYAAAKTFLKSDCQQGTTQQSLHHFWEVISYIGNTQVFILSGVVIVENILQDQNNITDQSWGLLFLLYALLQVSRVIVVIVLYPGLRYFGDGINLKEAIILIWSGLRGVVSLSLSLILNRCSDISGIPQLTRKNGALVGGGSFPYPSTLGMGLTTQANQKESVMEEDMQKESVLEEDMHVANIT